MKIIYFINLKINMVSRYLNSTMIFLVNKKRKKEKEKGFLFLMEYDLNDVIPHLTLPSGTWEKEEKLKMISIHFKANRKKSWLL